MAKRPLTVEELDALIGDRPVTEFLNARNDLYRERGFKEAPPGREEALRLMAAHSNLIRRPLLVVGDRIAFGFDAAAWEALLT
jgi:arsenate reductase-like glutaredoxin family protein